MLELFMNFTNNTCLSFNNQMLLVCWTRCTRNERMRKNLDPGDGNVFAGVLCFRAWINYE